MAKKANPKLIGGFVVGAISLLIVGALTFGGGQYFQPKVKGVLFFEGSLSGLDIGSPMTFRGVKVGSVTNIVIQYDTNKQVLRIPVYAEIEPNRIQVVTGERRSDNLKALIERGLRAQLQVQSLVTGQVAIDLDFHPENPARLVGADPSLPELPTMPSGIDVLKTNVTDFLARLSKLPVEEISAEILNILRDADQTIKESRLAVVDVRKLVNDADAQVAPIANGVVTLSDRANRTLADAQKLIRDVDADVPGLTSTALALMKKMGSALDEADGALSNAQRVLKPDSPLYVEINHTLQDIRATSTSMRALAEYIQRNPNSLLTGKR